MWNLFVYITLFLLFGQCRYIEYLESKNFILFLLKINSATELL